MSCPKRFFCRMPREICQIMLHLVVIDPSAMVAGCRHNSILIFCTYFTSSMSTWGLDLFAWHCPEVWLLEVRGKPEKVWQKQVSISLHLQCRSCVEQRGLLYSCEMLHNTRRQNALILLLSEKLHFICIACKIVGTQNCRTTAAASLSGKLSFGPRAKNFFSQLNRNHLLPLHSSRPEISIMKFLILLSVILIILDLIHTDHGDHGEEEPQEETETSELRGNF